MLYKAALDYLRDNAGGVLLLSGIVGGLVGGLVAGLAAALATYFLSCKLFRSKILDHARREIKGPLADYVEWLTHVAGEFSLWKADLLPAFLSDSSRDMQELNRMRRLFVDQRNSLWLSKLEEYDTLLHKFNPVIRAMWFRQMEINEGFNQVFRCLETDPPEALQAGGKIETLAFEQCQLTSDFLYQLQYECLRAVAVRKPRTPKDLAKPRIVRASFGRIKMMIPGKK